MRIAELVEQLRAEVAALDGVQLDREESLQVVSAFAEAERLAQAGRALASQQVLRTRAWRSRGYRTPAAYLADVTRGPLSAAIRSVETAHRLAELPATRRALVAGRLSEAQASEITAAATADPAAEQTLLSLAQRDGVAQLRERCRQVRAAASGDEASAERIRRSRYLRHWSQSDGAVHVDMRLAPDDGARFIAAVGPRAARLQDQAHRSGQRERAEAYAVDALMGIIDGAPGPRGVVHIHVDAAAWERGRVAPGETCGIEGVGPVSVAVARRAAIQGEIKLVGIDGADVTAISHLGRTIQARLLTALQARDRSCVVPGCQVRTNLQIDHILPRKDRGPTELANLARLCRYHHAQKTHHGWCLGGRPGAWTWDRGGAKRGPPARAP